jgi:hypothetical protein
MRKGTAVSKGKDRRRYNSLEKRQQRRGTKEGGVRQRRKEENCSKREDGEEK